MRYNRPIIKLIILCFAVIMAFTGCGKAVVKEQPVKNVKTIKATTGSISTTVEYPAKLKGIQEIAISPKNIGKVAQVNVSVGQAVKQGDVLFKMDTKDLEAQYQVGSANLYSANASYTDRITQAEKAFKQEKIKYDDAKRDYNDVSTGQISDSGKALKQATITYDDSKKQYDQNIALFQQGAISKQILDDSKNRLDTATVSLNNLKDTIASTYENAKITYDNAKYNLDILNSQTANTAQAQVKQATAGLYTTSVQIDSATVTSPISGVVSVRNVDNGEVAPSGQPTIVVIDTTSMIAEISIPDKMVDRISVGQALPVKISTMNDEQVQGIISNISPAADSATQTFTVKIKIDNSKALIKAGVFARVLFPAERKDNIIIVPNEAVSIENGVNYIYTVDGDVVRKIAVEIGLVNETNTEIKNALKEGTLIINEGQMFLSDGEKVNVL